MPSDSSLIDNLKYAWFGLRSIGLPLILRSLRYSFEKTYTDLKYAEPIKPRGGPRLWWQAIRTFNQPRPAPPPFDSFQQPGPVQSWQQKNTTLIARCQAACLQLTALSPQIIRVRLNEGGNFNIPFSYSIEKPDSDWPSHQVELVEQDAALLFKTDVLTVRIRKQDAQIDFLDAQAQPLNMDGGGFGWREGWVGLRRSLPPGAPLFGLGEQAYPLNLRGHQFELWHTDPGGRYRQGQNPLYQGHPWFITLNQNRAFGLLLDNTHRSFFDLGHRQPDCCTLTAAGGELRLYFIHGPALKDVLARLAALSGHMPLPPLWSLGLHQSRWGYKSKKMVQEIARQFRERQIPGDVIHLDIDYMKGKTGFTWHKGRFSDPAEMSQRLRQDGFRLVSIIDPGLKADRLNDIAEQGKRKGVFLKYPDGKVFRGPVWPGDCYFPDFTDPAVRIWWGEQYRILVEAGVSGFWNDMNEPSVFGLGDGTIPDPVRHSYEGRGADHAQTHNVYGMQMARATREGVSALRPEQRPFVLSRSGYTGIQRYAAVWTGDNESSWEHLRLSISMALNLGLSGVPFVGPDIGGFFGAPSGELFARWIQAAALFPLCRIHTAADTPSQEPWSFGPQVEAITRRAIELRYRLLPALYTAFWQASQAGAPIARPMLFDFQDDPQTYALDDQFMIGDSLLVAPVLAEGERARALYLPQGQGWVNYWTGQFHEGGQTLPVEAPLDCLPLFVKAGSVLPHWPLIQHTDQARTLSHIELHLFAAEGQSVLYEDAGQGFGYRRGEHKISRFVCRPTDQGLIITVRSQGDYITPYETVVWTVHTAAPIAPSAITADSLPISDWSVDAERCTVSFRIPISQRLEIMF